MSLRKNTKRYGSLSIGLHWVMLLLLAAVYACMELRGYFPNVSVPRAWHFMLGLTFFALVVVRLVVRMTTSPPPIKPNPPKLQTLSAKLVQIGLYTLMIGMPLAGWLLLSASGKPIPFFGLHLPALISKSQDMAELIQVIHETGGTAGYFLIGLHTVAALYHHYVVRDNTLLRMLPAGA